MEFTQTADVAITIRLNTAESTDTVVTSETRHDVTFQLRGSRSDLDRFAKKFRGLEVDFDLSAMKDFHSAPNQAIPSVLALESVPEVQELGLRVVSGSPAIIGGIDIEKLEPRTLPIDFIFKGAELAEPPSDSVEVWAPNSVWSRIPSSANIRKIRTIEKDLTNLPAGEEHEVSFQLIPAVGAETVKLAKSEVSVKLQVLRKTTTASETMSVAVKIVTPPEWTESGVWAEYKLVRREPIEWLAKITVTGPRKDIDILKTDKTKTVDAYIVLTDSDTEPIDSWSSRKVILRFPPDLQIQLASGQSEPTVQFRMEKRTAATP
jgi:hypothetical protein